MNLICTLIRGIINIKNNRVDFGYIYCSGKQKAKDNLRTVPIYIARKVGTWIDAVAHDGLLAVRKIPGFHDEPLKGERKGQRSIRLSKSYRAIYIIGRQGNIEIAEIIEVNKHDY